MTPNLEILIGLKPLQETERKELRFVALRKFQVVTAV